MLKPGLEILHRSPVGGSPPIRNAASPPDDRLPPDRVVACLLRAQRVAVKQFNERQAFGAAGDLPCGDVAAAVGRRDVAEAAYAERRVDLCKQWSVVVAEPDREPRAVGAAAGLAGDVEARLAVDEPGKPVPESRVDFDRRDRRVRKLAIATTPVLRAVRCRNALLAPRAAAARRLLAHRERSRGLGDLALRAAFVGFALHEGSVLSCRGPGRSCAAGPSTCRCTSSHVRRTRCRAA